MGDLHHLTYKQEKQMLEDAYARRLLLDYDIREVTTQRQAKNGTREFEFPVPARYRFYNGKLEASKDRLRLAIFKSGYVRNQNSCSSNYQLNPTYKRVKKWVFMSSTLKNTVTKSYITRSRAKIFDELTRLNYMLEFYLRNYITNTNKAR